MTEALQLLAVLAGGLLVGLVSFGGLWWAVRRLVDGESRWWVFPLGSLLRTALVLGGFWLLSAGGDLPRLACGVVGWLLARQLMIRRFGPGREPSEKGGHPCT